MYQPIHRVLRSREQPHGVLVRLGLALAIAATLVAPISQVTPAASAHHGEATLEAFLDTIHVLDDSDGFLRGSGELEYTLFAKVGSSQCLDTWCGIAAADTVGFSASTGDVRGGLGAHISWLRPRAPDLLGVRIKGRELDDGTADQLGTVEARFTAAQNWGIGSHTIENSMFRAEYRIVARLTPDLEVTRLLIDGDEPHYGSLPTRVCADIYNDGFRAASGFGLTVLVAGSPLTLPTPLTLQPHTGARYCGSATVVPGVHEVSAVVDPDDAVLESDANNNRRVETFTWAAAPDLQLEDIWSTGLLVEGEPQEVCARARNAGPGAAGPFRMSIRLGRNLNYYYPPGAAIDLAGLAAGARVEHCVAVAENADLSQSVLAEVDAWDAVTELSEGNNERRETFRIYAPLPDLMVPSVERPALNGRSQVVPSIEILDKANASVSDCDPGKHGIAVKIKNAGYLAAGGFGVALSVDGKTVATREVAALGRGASTTVTFADVDLKARHKIGVTLDSKSQVAEMREDNNLVDTWVSCVVE